MEWTRICTRTSFCEKELDEKNKSVQLTAKQRAVRQSLAAMFPLQSLISVSDFSWAKHRFSNVDPDFMLARLSKVRSFEKEREIALERVLKNYKIQCELLSHGIGNETEAEKRIATPHKVFSWFAKDFYKRRRIKNVTWLELFRMQMSREGLEVRKFHYDVNEIYKLLELWLQEFTSKDTKIVRLLTEAAECIDVEASLKEELATNTEAVRQYLNNVIAFTLSKGDDERARVLADLEYKIMSSHVHDPIELRYQMNYYKVAADYWERSFLMDQTALESEIERIGGEIETEKYCSQCVLNALYADISKFKVRIDEMNEKYAANHEAIENEIIYKKLSLEKMRTQYNYLVEQIARFREEIENTILQIKLEEERHEIERIQQKELMEQELLAKAQKKGKGRGKRK